jgi:ribosomal-protein-alanine N-acetyltransferase
MSAEFHFRPLTQANAEAISRWHYARRHFEPTEFVLLVATFNRRAINVYERAGFIASRVFMHSTNGGDWEFVEMRRPA